MVPTGVSSLSLLSITCAENPLAHSSDKGVKETPVESAQDPLLQECGSAHSSLSVPAMDSDSRIPVV